MTSPILVKVKRRFSCFYQMQMSRVALIFVCDIVNAVIALSSIVYYKHLYIDSLNKAPPSFYA